MIQFSQSVSWVRTDSRKNPIAFVCIVLLFPRWYWHYKQLASVLLQSRDAIKDIRSALAGGRNKKGKRDCILFLRRSQISILSLRNQLWSSNSLGMEWSIQQPLMIKQLLSRNNTSEHFHQYSQRISWWILF